MNLTCDLNEEVGIKVAW